MTDSGGIDVEAYRVEPIAVIGMACRVPGAGDVGQFWENLVGGVESVSRPPPIAPAPHPAFAEAAARADRTFESGAAWRDPRESGDVPDVYIAMGKTAEFVARSTGTTRRDQDEWALESQRRAARAIEAGYFEREIVPHTRRDGVAVTRDDGPRPSTTLDGLAGLDPAFHPEGTVTAGNASPLNDGASALVVMRADRARALGITPLARILGSSASGVSPEIMGLGPVEATDRLLRRRGLTVGDIDLVELNEAFAAQVVPVVRQLGLDPERVNPHGGAIALGHPFGATGARLVGTLINGLASRDEALGLATLCVGGGQGMAMVIERVS